MDCELCCWLAVQGGWSYPSGYRLETKAGLELLWHQIKSHGVPSFPFADLSDSQRYPPAPREELTPCPR